VSIRLLIADDQALVRAGFRKILESEPGFEVVAEAEDGLAAVDAAAHSRPDLVLMDIRMPRLDGIAATRRILERGAERLRVLMLTTYGLDEYVYEALRAGASGFLLKDVPPERLVDAVTLVAAGEALLDPSVTRAVIEEFVRRAPVGPTVGSELDELTERELEVLKLLTRGQSNAEIAQTLVVSDATAKTHVAHVLMKLGVRDRVQAVIYAYESGLVQPGHAPAA
jgi:DNA-binding NarL/FixJ family response regulator